MADNLTLPQISGSQDQKEQTSNDADAQLSGAVADTLACDLSAASYSLLLADFQTYMGFTASGNTVARTFTLPVKKRALFFVVNNGTALLTVTLGTTSFVLAPGTGAFYGQDGTANGLVNRTGSGTLDIPYTFSGKPKTGQNLVWPFNRPIKLPAGLLGSNVFVGVNPFATATFTITKYHAGSGTSVGTIAISTGGVATITFTVDVSLAIGDALEISAPSPQDSNLSDVGIALLAVLQ